MKTTTEYKTVTINDDNISYYTLFSYNKCHSYIRYFNILPNNFEATEIVDGIYIGSIQSAFDFKKLKELDIKHVISVLSGFEPPFSNDISYTVIDALDSEKTELSEVFEETSELLCDIFDNGEKVLVHCSAGRSRSATIILAFIIKKFGLDVQTALKQMQQKRHIVEPNPSFLKQLEEYYNKLYL